MDKSVSVAAAKEAFRVGAISGAIGFVAGIAITGNLGEAAKVGLASGTLGLAVGGLTGYCQAKRNADLIDKLKGEIDINDLAKKLGFDLKAGETMVHVGDRPCASS